MAKVKLQFETNARKVGNELSDIGAGVDNIGGKTDNLSGKFGGMSAKIAVAFGPLIVGGAIAKGITAMVDELTMAAEQTTKIAIATRELRGLAGTEGVERMERLAKELKVEKTVVAGLLSQAISGGAGMTDQEQDQLVKEGIFAQRGKGIPAADLIDMTTRTFNADPENFRAQGGVVGAANQVLTGIEFSNMTAQQGRAMMPAISAAAGIGLPTAVGEGLFAALSQSSATPFEAGTQSRKVLNTFATKKEGGEDLEAFMARTARLPQGQRNTLFGEEAGSAPVAFMKNLELFRTTVSKEILAANDSSQAKRAYDDSLKDSKVLVADITEKSKSVEGNKELSDKEAEIIKDSSLKWDARIDKMQDVMYGYLKFFVEGPDYLQDPDAKQSKASVLFRGARERNRVSLSDAEEGIERIAALQAAKLAEKTAKSLQSVSLTQQKSIGKTSKANKEGGL